MNVTDLPPLPALVIGNVSHQRSRPIRNGFEHRVYQWLVDLDDLPVLPRYLRPFASFRAEDHLGDMTGPTTEQTGFTPWESLRHRVDDFLRDHGVDLGADGRVIMLGNARVLGHVFDPLTVHWCFDSLGSLRCVIAEVHNTYGERHAYLLEPDGSGRAEAQKRFYVSPFNDVTGHYQLQFDLSGDHLRVAVSLVRDRPLFTAVFDGRPQPASRSAIVRTLLRFPAMPQQVSLWIRLHGIRLWTKRLPISPHPTQTPGA